MKFVRILSAAMILRMNLPIQCDDVDGKDYNKHDWILLVNADEFPDDASYDQFPQHSHGTLESLYCFYSFWILILFNFIQSKNPTKIRIISHKKRTKKTLFLFWFSENKNRKFSDLKVFVFFLKWWTLSSILSNYFS